MQQQGCGNKTQTIYLSIAEALSHQLPSLLNSTKRSKAKPVYLWKLAVLLLWNSNSQAFQPLNLQNDKNHVACYEVVHFVDWLALLCSYKPQKLETKDNTSPELRRLVYLYCCTVAKLPASYVCWERIPSVATNWPPFSIFHHLNAALAV